MNQALDTLGYTKWRVNKRVLAVVDRIWANGGRLAGLVDREDVRYTNRQKNVQNLVSIISSVSFIFILTSNFCMIGSSA